MLIVLPSPLQDETFHAHGTRPRHGESAARERPGVMWMFAPLVLNMIVALVALFAAARFAVWTWAR